MQNIGDTSTQFVVYRAWKRFLMREEFSSTQRETLKRAVRSFGSWSVIPLGISVNKIYSCFIPFISRVAWNSQRCSSIKHFSSSYHGSDSSCWLSSSELWYQGVEPRCDHLEAVPFLVTWKPSVSLETFQLNSVDFEADSKDPAKHPPQSCLFWDMFIWAECLLKH